MILTESATERDLRHRLEELTQLVGALVNKAGGEVALGSPALDAIQDRDFEVEVTREELYRRVVIRSRVKEGARDPQG